MQSKTDCQMLFVESGKVRIASYAVFASLFFVPLLFGVAMAVFPAGHYGAENGYSFSKHVVSDLGRTCISNGTHNTLSCGIFATAMTLSGIVCALFWLARASFLKHPVARRVAVWAGMAMSVSMAAIGFTPLNLVAKVHDPITGLTAVAAALAVLALFVDRDDSLEKPAVKYAWFVVIVLVLSGWTALVALHHFKLLAFRPWLPIGQKTLISTFILWMAYQAYLLYRRSLST